MKEISRKLEDKLLLYADGQLIAAEQRAMEEQLKHDELLRNKLDQLKGMNQMLQNLKPDQPSRNFTQLVMSRLDEYPAYTNGLSIRNGIFLLVGVLVAAGIGVFLLSSGLFDNATTTLDFNPELTKRYFDQPMPSIPFNGKIVVNALVLLNLGLAWLVLDRAILKPYFQKRMQSAH